MADPFKDDYRLLFGTTEVTPQQKNYHYLVDLYRNNMLKEEQMNMLPYKMQEMKAILAKRVLEKEVEILRDGAAAAEELHLNRVGESGMARYLRDVKAIYPEIDQFPRFNQKWDKFVKDAQVVAAPKRQSINLDTVGPAIVAEGFYVGARAGAQLGDFVFQLKQGLQSSGLNLTRDQENDYLKIATTAAGIASGARKYSAFAVAEKALEKLSGDYDRWATSNGLNDKQREAMDPIAPAQRRIEQERLAKDAAQSKQSESFFDLGW